MFRFEFNIRRDLHTKWSKGRNCKTYSKVAPRKGEQNNENENKNDNFIVKLSGCFFNFETSVIQKIHLFMSITSTCYGEVVVVVSFKSVCQFSSAYGS